MKLTEMIELANNGVKAKDVLTLHRQGFTKDIILELSEEPAPVEPKEPDEPKPEPEPATPKDAGKNEQVPKDDPTNPVMEELNRLKEELVKEREKVAELQKQNRTKNIDDLGNDKDPLKNINDMISSLM